MKNAWKARTSVLHVQRITNQAIPHVSVPVTGVCGMEESVNGAWFLSLQLIAKKVIKLIEEMQVNKTIDPAFEYLAFFPDSVHVRKSLKCSFCNWFIILNGERGSLSIIQTLRDDSNPVVRKKLRKLLKAEDV